MNYKSYLDSFEREVIIPGVDSGRLGKKGMITIKKCKLSNTPFGDFVGLNLVHEVAMAIDYYGLIKKSVGMLRVIEEYKNIEIKSILVPTVYFASVKNEDITELAPHLLNNFPLFKSYLIQLRGFKINQK